MIQEEILQGNKLIAEFMGAKPCKLIRLIDGYEFKKWKLPIDEIEYHSSWDWLMPVVEKIESIEDDYHGHFGVHICSNGCTIQATNFRPDKPIPNPPHYFSDVTLNTKLEATYKAIIYFIQWYNTQTK